MGLADGSLLTVEAETGEIVLWQLDMSQLRMVRMQRAQMDTLRRIYAVPELMYCHHLLPGDARVAHAGGMGESRDKRARCTVLGR